MNTIPFPPRHLPVLPKPFAVKPLDVPLRSSAIVPFPKPKPLPSGIQPKVRSEIECASPDSPLRHAQLPFLTMEDPFQPGAILYSSWGYEQTNVDFYRVIKRTDKSITFVPLGRIITEKTFMAGKAVPTELTLSEGKQPEQFRRLLNHYEGRFTGCKFDKGRFVRLWKGDPLSCSWYA